MISTLYLNFTDLSFFSAFKERERHNPQHWDVCKRILFYKIIQMGAEIHVVEKDQDPEEEETEVLKCLPAENKKTETRNRSQVKIKELFKTLSSKWYI